MLNFNRSEAAGGYYRPDIDGLRAIAVLPVVFYHYRLPGFSGGFVGVDVFFVISGFLITQLIYAEMREGRFSIVQFYERRIRRIFPALFVLLVGITLLALALLFPRDLQQFAKTLWGTAVFVSNFVFWQQAGYFDSAAEAKPLLHTWSLAVEEQFYLAWPAILLAAVSLRGGANRRAAFVVVCVLLILSLAEGIREVSSAPVAAFYLLPSRMWELMLGATLAVGSLPQIGNRLARNAVGLLGLALIAWSVFAYTRDTPFPGLAAVPPCFGTALLIHTGERRDTWTAKALSSPPLVSLGLLSYSLYLWHWPLYAFARYVTDAVLGAVAKCLLILLSIVLAWISYRFVEQPFRARKVFLSRRPLFVVAGAAMACAVMAGVALDAAGGLPERYPVTIQRLLASANQREPRRARCFNLSLAQVRAGHLCRIGDPRAKPDFLLWGDSHADALLPAVEEAAAAKHRAGLVASRPACPPLLGVERADIARVQCRDFNAAVAQIAAHAKFREIVLAARWAKHAEGNEFGEEGQTAFLQDAESRRLSTVENHAVFLRGLSRTLSFLRRVGKKIVIVGPVPESSSDVPEALARAQLFHSSADRRPPVTAFRRRESFVLRALRQAADGDATIVYPDRVLCHAGRCDVERSGHPLYADSNHLTVFGARQLTPLLRPIF